jgi:oxygen-dependent protoporphyrinogen oxidase
MERALAAVAAVPGLALAGAAVGGVGIPACIATAERAAAAVTFPAPAPPPGRRAAGAGIGGE